MYFLISPIGFSSSMTKDVAPRSLREKHIKETGAEEKMLERFGLGKRTEEQ